MSVSSCVIFDFDGVIADTERLHLQAYNATFAAHEADIGGPLSISPEQYYTNYIVYGDREGFFQMLEDAGRRHNAELLRRLAVTKHDLFEKNLGTFADPLPGVRELLTFLEERLVPRAICSGARRSEIMQLLEAFNLRHHFDIIVTIEDVSSGKPDPEGYLLAFEKLNLEYDAELDKSKSLVIEDSAGGIAAGRAAGLRVLGVATSLPLESVQRYATFAVDSLANLPHTQVAEWLSLHGADAAHSK